MSLAVPQTYQLGKVDGKGAFKEEFVTAGGVPLPGELMTSWTGVLTTEQEVDMTKMESKVVPGLFFAGEVRIYFHPFPACYQFPPFLVSPALAPLLPRLARDPADDFFSAPRHRRHHRSVTRLCSQR